MGDTGLTGPKVRSVTIWCMIGTLYTLVNGRRVSLAHFIYDVYCTASYHLFTYLLNLQGDTGDQGIAGPKVLYIIFIHLFIHSIALLLTFFHVTFISSLIVRRIRLTRRETKVKLVHKDHKEKSGRRVGKGNRFTFVCFGALCFAYAL